MGTTEKLDADTKEAMRKELQALKVELQALKELQSVHVSLRDMGVANQKTLELVQSMHAAMQSMVNELERLGQRVAFLEEKETRRQLKDEIRREFREEEEARRQFREQIKAELRQELRKGE
jgi:hypothetical protein